MWDKGVYMELGVSQGFHAASEATPPADAGSLISRRLSRRWRVALKGTFGLRPCGLVVGVFVLASAERNIIRNFSRGFHDAGASR